MLPESVLTDEFGVSEEKEEKKQPVSVEDETIRTNLILFYNNITVFHRQQYTNAYLFARTIFHLFKDAERLDRLEEMFFDVCQYMFKYHNIDKLSNISASLAQLEWIYYRDSQFPVPSNKIIPVSGRGREDLEFSTLLFSLQVCKADMNAMVADACIDNRVPLEADYFLPTNKGREIGKIGI